MLAAHHIAWQEMEGQRAFEKAKRARRWRRAGTLDVHDARSLARRTPGRNTPREIPLGAIVGTFDAGRSRQFDRAFRPNERTRRRWLSVWTAPGDLPPIDVVQVGEQFAVLDGHHRVSVARARGAATICAVVS